MPYLLDAIYLLTLLVLSPWLVYKSLTTGKYRRGIVRKLLGWVPRRAGSAPCVWFHGVSVGEVHLLRSVVACFRQRHPDWDCVVSTTTDTGLDEARKAFPDLPVFFWPFDFSWAVRRALRAVNPSLVVLAEAELWPNFLLAARRRGVPVAVINGRLSPRSFRNYWRLRGLARPLLARIDLFAVQTEHYADCFRTLGVAADRIRITGSVKYDGVLGDRDNPRTQELGRLLGVRDTDLVWIAGSTQAPEEEIVLGIYERLQPSHPNLRLFLVPRQRERFEEVAALLGRSGTAFLRRSELAGPVQSGEKGSGVLNPRTREKGGEKGSRVLDFKTPDPFSPPAVVLVDSIGELGALWGLAHVAFVGGSLDGRRGGQNMIEPAACGAAVVFGPHVWNFQDTASRLVEAGAAVQVADAEALEHTIRRLLADPLERQHRATAARRFVRSQQGATARTVECLESLLQSRPRHDKAA